MRNLTPARVRAMLYKYPELLAEYHVLHGGTSVGERVQSGPGRPTEREALRLVEVSRQIQLIERMIAHLKGQDLELVQLRYFHQLSWAAVAKALRISASTAWERDRRIIDSIVERMKKDPAIF